MLLVMRPREWIRDVGEAWGRKDWSMGERVVMVGVVGEAVGRLGEGKGHIIGESGMYREEGIGEGGTRRLVSIRGSK